MRLQVSVLPHARAEPYDVYGDVAFMPPELTSAGDPGVPKAEVEAACPAMRDVPTVIPLLVTDIAEQSLQSRAVEIMRQLGLALGGTIQGVALGADFGNARDEIAQVLGADINALSTVARLNANTIRVRFGASNTGSSRYAILPRTNTVTVLVLVPSEQVAGCRLESVPVAMHTRLRHAETGELLPDIDLDSWNMREEEVERIVGTYEMAGNGLSAAAAAEEVRKLSDYVTRGKYADFAGVIEARGWQDFKELLWTDLTSLRAGYGDATASAWLPWREPPVLPYAQEALLLDDLTSRATVQLAGAADIDGDELEARLAIGGVQFAALGIERRGDDLVLAFPSPAAWNAAPQAAAGSAAAASLSLWVDDDSVRANGCRQAGAAPDAALCAPSYPVTYKPRRQDPKLPFEVVTTVNTVAFDKTGTATYRFALSGAGSVTMRGEGVAIDQVQPGRALREQLAWQLSEAGVVDVRFVQLTAGQKFKLVFAADNGATGAIALEAKALP
jgi:hypothetical protein